MPKAVASAKMKKAWSSTLEFVRPTQPRQKWGGEGEACSSNHDIGAMALRGEVMR